MDQSPRIRTTQKYVKNTCYGNDHVRSPTRPVKSFSASLPIKAKPSGPPTKASVKENMKPVDFKLQSMAKENTKSMEVKLQTKERAVKRAFFNYSVAAKLYLMEQQKRQIERIQKIIEEEEVRMLRKEMIPRAQLMPLFDRPFVPRRLSCIKGGIHEYKRDLHLPQKLQKNRVFRRSIETALPVCVNSMVLGKMKHIDHHPH